MSRLIVLRPEPGASETARRALELGLDPVKLPLFRIEPVQWQAPDPAAFDGLLLTSANALRHGGEGLVKLRSLPVHAVGEATARAAREAGFDICSTGCQGLEQLLGAIESNAKLLHLCGEHRTPYAARQPIVAVPVYRSIDLAPPPALDEAEGAIVAVHSPRAARRFAELASKSGIDRGRIRIAAISAAAAEAAGTGWARVEWAAKPDDEALLAVAARLCDKAPQQ